MNELALTRDAAKDGASRTGLRGWPSRVRTSFPPLAQAVGGGLFWMLAIAACAAQGLYAEGWQTVARIREVVLVYLAGAFLAFPLALCLARFVALGRSREIAFAAFFVALAGSTIATTAIIYALDYRAYYTQWHAEAFTITWMFQFGFTIAGALYQFAVLGLRLYMPFGLLALLLAALWFARQPR